MEDLAVIYTRVSRVGEREQLRSTEEQEAVCREWIEDNDADCAEVYEEENVSGKTAVEDRKLEQAVKRVESGEVKTVVCYTLDRFGRDMIAACLALKRIKDAGGRLVAVEDDFDSDARRSQERFYQLMATAEAFITRNEGNWERYRKRARERGVYLASRAPFGFKRVDEVEPEYGSRGQLLKDGRLVEFEEHLSYVPEIFDRKGSGQNVGQIQRWLESEGVTVWKTRGKCFGPLTKSGVRSILSNRAYVGEFPDGEGGVIKNAIKPVITEAQWERAQATEGDYHPRDGSLAEQLLLSGLVVCDTCGKRCSPGGYGPPGRRTATYICTRPKTICKARAGMKAEWVHEHVEAVVREALLNVKDPDTGVPAHPGSVYVGAILEGDDRYTKAEEAVAEARKTLEEYRDNIALQKDLGLDSFTEGLRVRKEAYRLAQKALREAPRPTFGSPDEKLTVENADRAFYQRFVSEIRLRPASEGEERIEVRFHGQPAAKLAEAA
jgi:DNA invertase Pin-like site-specific DNA recombinase